MVRMCYLLTEMIQRMDEWIDERTDLISGTYHFASYSAILKLNFLHFLPKFKQKIAQKFKNIAKKMNF